MKQIDVLKGIILELDDSKHDESKPKKKEIIEDIDKKISEMN